MAKIYGDGNDSKGFMMILMTGQLLLGLISPKNTLDDDENNFADDCVDEIYS